MADEKNPDYVARGLKAAIHNPNVSAEAKAHAAKQLKEMGVGPSGDDVQHLSEDEHRRHQLGKTRARFFCGAADSKTNIPPSWLQSNFV